MSDFFQAIQLQKRPEPRSQGTRQPNQAKQQKSPHAHLKVGSLLANTPYWDLIGDCMVLDSGLLEIGIAFTPQGRLFLTDDMLERLHQQLKTVLQQGVDRLERARIYVAARQAAPEVLYPYRDQPDSPHDLINLVALDRYQYLEDLRRNNGITQWSFYLTCTVRPPTKFSKEAPPSSPELVDALSKARTAAARLISYLQGAGFTARRMTNNEMMAACYPYLNPDQAGSKPPSFVPPDKRIRAKVKLGSRKNPDLLTLKRQLCQSELNNEDMNHVMVGRTHIAVLSLARSPQRTVMGMVGQFLERLSAGSFYLVVDILHLDPVDTERNLETAKNRLFSQMGSGTKEAPNVKAQAKLEEVNKTIKHLTTTGDHAFKVGLGVVLLAPSARELEMMREQTISASGSIPGASLVNHDFQSLFQWFALLPFSGKTSHFLFESTETNAADFFPPIAPWKGGQSPTWVLRTRQNSLANVDFFAGGTAANHFALFAPTGWGKTFAVMSLLAAHIRVHDPYVTVVDRKQDFKHFIAALSSGQQANSSVIAFYPGSGNSLNPMDLPEGETAPDAVKQAYLLALIRYFVPPSSHSREAGEEKALILEGVNQTYRRVQREKRSPLLSEFATTMTAMEMYADGASIPKEQQSLARSIALRLKPYLGQESAWGPILDRQTNVNTNAQFVYYDLSGIGDSDVEMRRVALHIVQDRIWQSAKRLPLNIKKIAFMDEFGSQIKTEEDRDFVSTVLRLARSTNLAFGLATQTLEDMKQIRGMEEAIYYYLLGRLEGGEDVIREVLKLPDSVVREISKLRKTQDWVEWALIFRPSDGQKDGDIVRVEESKGTYWYLTSEPNEAAQREQYLKKHGSLKLAVEAILAHQGGKYA